MKKNSLNVKDESIHSWLRFGLISFAHCMDLISYSHLPAVKKLQKDFLIIQKNLKDNTVKLVLKATSEQRPTFNNDPPNSQPAKVYIYFLQSTSA